MTNNPSAPPVRIFINEWMAANTSFLIDPTDSVFDDWFELFNPNTASVSLDGYSLSDRITGSGRWTIPAGTSIPAQGYLLVWADENVEQNGLDAGALHAGFKLSQGGEAIALFAPDGSLVDSVTFGSQTNNVSQGRWPDGGTNLFFMPTPTPRSVNQIPSTPGDEIRLLATTLAPNGDLTLRWSAAAGRTYRVQFKDDLNTTGWVELGEVTASGTEVSTTIPRGGAPRGFYRVQLKNP